MLEMGTVEQTPDVIQLNTIIPAKLNPASQFLVFKSTTNLRAYFLLIGDTLFRTYSVNISPNYLAIIDVAVGVVRSIIVTSQ